MKPKKSRRHGSAPANWQFRAGRPRWIPSPALRAAGWRGCDLRDARGAFLSEGASIDRARAINACVAAWRAGKAIAAEFEPVGPAGATLAGRAAEDARAIGALIDAYLASREFAALRDNTRAGYRTKLKRLIDTLAGYAALPKRGDPSYAGAVARVRSLSIDALEPPAFGEPGAAILKEAYWALRDQVGHHQANGVLAVAEAWLAWCLAERRAIRLNAAKLVAREEAPGRIRPGTWAEIKALIEAADALGLVAIGDGIVLGVDLSWSQGDRLALTWARVVDGRAFTGLEGRQKTGRVGGTPFLELGLARLTQIRARQLAMVPRPSHVLWNPATAAPFTGRVYRLGFEAARARAALAVASVASLTDQDLRDTAFTWARNAGLNDDQTASRTLQSRKHIAQLADRHYGEIGAEIADQGRDKLNAYMKAGGMKL